MYRKLLIAIVCVTFGVVLYQFTGISDTLTLENLQEHKSELVTYVETNPLHAIVIFSALYFISVAASLPVASLLSIASGFLFGTFLGTVLVVIVATLGASAVFLLARVVLGKRLLERYGQKLVPITKEIEENGFNHLLFLRLVPLVPFFLVNIAPSFTGMRLRTYMLATFIGIVPGSFVYVNAGKSLANINSLSEIISPTTLGALALLGVVSLVPVFWKRFKKEVA